MGQWHDAHFCVRMYKIIQKYNKNASYSYLNTPYDEMFLISEKKKVTFVRLKEIKHVILV